MKKLIVILFAVALTLTACSEDVDIPVTSSDDDNSITSQDDGDVSTNVTTAEISETEEEFSLIGSWSVEYIVDGGERLTIAEFAETWDIANSPIDMSTMVYEMYSSFVVKFVDDNSGIAEIFVDDKHNRLDFTYDINADPIVLINEYDFCIDGGTLGQFEFELDLTDGRLINQTISSSKDTYYILKKIT